MTDMTDVREFILAIARGPVLGQDMRHWIEQAMKQAAALEPPATPVPVREWKCGLARAVVMQDDDCFLWIVSDTPEDAAYLTRDQFASLLLAGKGLLAAMGEG